MAKIENVNFALIKKWEGGLSKNKKDAAAKFPVPDGSGYHTNMGITWQTFSSNAQKLGYVATSATFKNMTQAVWLKIYKSLYWNAVKGDEIESQAIAEFLTEWAWGSGPGTSAKHLQAYLNLHLGNQQPLNVDGKIGKNTLTALHNLIQEIGERIVFEDLDRMKRDVLKSSDSINTFGLGWYNRMDDFRNYAVSIIS